MLVDLSCPFGGISARSTNKVRPEDLNETVATEHATAAWPFTVVISSAMRTKHPTEQNKIDFCNSDPETRNSASFNI